MCAASAADTPLRHNYYALRHGQSLANVEGVISSDPAVACNHHGLSETGLQQARRAAEAVCAEALSTGVDGVAIVSSDFKRAWQTAQAVHTAVIARGLSCVPASAVCAETLHRGDAFPAVCTSQGTAQPHPPKILRRGLLQDFHHSEPSA